MRLDELSPSLGSTTNRKRVGRGTGSGIGKTCGKGHKGQNSRAGGGVKPGFECGQMPLHRRLPKRGFHNKFAKIYTEVTLDMLNKLENDQTVNAESLKAARIISKINDGIVILATGELNKKLNVQASRFTKNAKEQIEKAGGTAEVV